jgi:hypothetical protein
MKTTSPRIACLALAATLALSACAHQARYATEDGAPTSAVAVEVANHNWLDVVVYAISGGNRVRLGSVTTGLEGRFRLPRSMVVQSGNLFLEAHLVGSNQMYRSDPIMVNPGSRVIWSLENQLGLSSYRVASGK